MVLQRLVVLVDRFMATHQWSHNEHYHRWIERHLPPTPRRCLDVGCGTGELARLLRSRSPQVVGLDADAEMIALAQGLSPSRPDLTFAVGSVLDLPPQPRYDVITAVAVLHHVPFAAAVVRLRAALAPGGTLLVVGCHRDGRRSDRLLGFVASIANVLVGAIRGQAQPPVSMAAPVAAPTMTLTEIRTTAERLLPGVRIRRALFWRHLLRFTVPPELSSSR